MLVAHLGDRSGGDVGDHDVGSDVEKVADQVATDLAHAGDADSSAGQHRGGIGVAPDRLGGGTQAAEDAVRRQHAAVARAAVRLGATGHVRRLPGDDVHVLAEGADVARGDVAAVERLHEAPVGPEQRLGLLGRRVADDDGLAATEVEAGDGGLVGHPAREREHVGERVRGRGVGVEAGAAQGGPEGRRVDRDDRTEAAGGIVGEDDLFMLEIVLEEVAG